VKRRFAAGRGDQRLLHRGHVLDQPLGELDLELGHADAHQIDATHRVEGCAIDVRVVVPQQRRAEGRVEVDVGSAFAVGEPGSLGRGDDQLLEPRDPALAAVDAARDHLARALRQGGSSLRSGLGHLRAHYNDPPVVRQQII
jgi:hypothetical protein